MNLERISLFRVTIDLKENLILDEKDLLSDEQLVYGLTSQTRL